MRTVLHSDLNSFFASVTCFYKPAIRHLPVAVCGSQSERHGIVLAANTLAKSHGVRTGDVIWQALQKCPQLHTEPPNYEWYVRHSKAARRIYLDYTPLVQSFGIDENWLDVTDSLHLFGSGEEIAREIQWRVYKELGVTVSIGVSFNKTFSKLGSDMKKPNGITIIGKDDIAAKVWTLPVSDLLYVGKATTAKLHRYGIATIGSLVQTDPKWLHKLLGKRGVDIWRSANGLESDPVIAKDYAPIEKSIGNSTTAPRDLETLEDVKAVIMLLAESVAERMRQRHFHCHTVTLSLRYTDLSWIERQSKVEIPCSTAKQLTDTAMILLARHWNREQPLRGVGVRASDLEQNVQQQLSLFGETQQIQKQEELEGTVQELRRRFGHFSLQKGIMLAHRDLSRLDTRKESSAQSVAFMR